MKVSCSPMNTGLRLKVTVDDTPSSHLPLSWLLFHSTIEFTNECETNQWFHPAT